MMHFYEYPHFIRKYKDKERIIPICLATLKNRVRDGKPPLREIPVRLVIDTGAGVTRLNEELSHYFFSTDINLESDYINSERKVVVSTGGGKADRYLYNLDELQLTDSNGNPLISFNNIEVNLVPPDLGIETNVLGMNVLSRLEKIEIDSKKTKIFIKG